MTRTVFAGGTIFTGGAGHPRARAVAMEKGRIVALDGAALEAADGGAEKVDLAGRSLVPGFHDGHIHPMLGGAQLAEAPISGVDSLPRLLDNVARYAREHPERPWIRGFGWMPPLLPGGLGDAAVLDRIVPDRPVALTASDGHTMWVNSAALAQAGITVDTPEPPRGAVVRRADGSPLGTLLESAQDLVTRVMPPFGPAERQAGALAAFAEMRAAGITWAQDALAEPEDVADYVALASGGRLTARVNVALRALPERWPQQRPGFLAAREAAERAAAETAGFATVRTVKFFADGIIESGTAALLEPYCDHADTHGIPNWTAEGLTEAVTAFDADRFQTHIHAIGDAGVRLALDAIEAAAGRNAAWDRRPVIAHTQLVHPDDLPRFAALGVIANFEPLWAQLDPTMVDLTLHRLGSERSAWQYPIAGIVATGARVSFGSDWPVTSMRPLEGLAIAVTRQTRAGNPPGGWLPEQRVDLDTAIRLYTAGGAYQAFADGEAGVLAPGLRADLVVLGADLDGMPPGDIADVPVEATYVDGVAVHHL